MMIGLDYKTDLWAKGVVHSLHRKGPVTFAREVHKRVVIIELLPLDAIDRC